MKEITKAVVSYPVQCPECDTTHSLKFNPKYAASHQKLCQNCYSEKVRDYEDKVYRY